MRAPACLLPILICLLMAPPLAAQTGCGTWQQCRDDALAARDRGDGEAFHDLAWRAVQTGPRNDAALMFLLARAQSVSGRPHDALVMLQRLLDRDVDLTDAETSDDFQRLRALAGWPDLLDRMRTARVGEAATTVAPRAPTLPMPTPPAPRPSPTAAPPKAAATAGAPTVPVPREALARSRILAAPTVETSARPTTVTDALTALALPATIREPLALAYDGVSGRLVVADGASGTLKVLSELSGNAVDLVSRGWGGPYRTTAMAIDDTRGDLWVAASANDHEPSPAPAVVHRLQLVSGRLLYSVPAATDRGTVVFSSLAVAGSRVFVLDTAGGRIFELPSGQKTLRERVTLGVDGTASLTVADSDVAYIAHERGLLRVTLTGGRPAAVESAADVPIDNLRWVGHHGRSLLGVQRQSDGTHLVVRLRLDARGRRVTSREVLASAASATAAIVKGVLFYVAAQPDGSTAILRLALR